MRIQQLLRLDIHTAGEYLECSNWKICSQPKGNLLFHGYLDVSQLGYV